MDIMQSVELLGRVEAPADVSDVMRDAAAMLAAGQWAEASETVKDALVLSGADSGALKVYVVPETATVSVDFGGAS